MTQEKPFLENFKTFKLTLKLIDYLGQKFTGELTRPELTKQAVELREECIKHLEKCQNKAEEKQQFEKFIENLTTDMGDTQ